MLYFAALAPSGATSGTVTASATSSPKCRLRFLPSCERMVVLLVECGLVGLFGCRRELACDNCLANACGQACRRLLGRKGRRHPPREAGEQSVVDTTLACELEDERGF